MRAGRATFAAAAAAAFGIRAVLAAMRLVRLFLAYALRLGASVFVAWWSYEAFHSLYLFRRPGSDLPGPEGLYYAMFAFGVVCWLIALGIAHLVQGRHRLLTQP